jgi:hypothetical protein
VRSKSETGDGTNQCVIWGTFRGIRQPGTGFVAVPAISLVWRIKGGSPGFCVSRNRLSRVTCGRARDKQKIDDRLGMCQGKRKMEGFM